MKTVVFRLVEPHHHSVKLASIIPAQTKWLLIAFDTMVQLLIVNSDPSHPVLCSGHNNFPSFKDFLTFLQVLKGFTTHGEYTK